MTCKIGWIWCHMKPSIVQQPGPNVIYYPNLCITLSLTKSNMNTQSCIQTTWMLPTCICEAWRSMVMMWSAPATDSMLATNLAEMGARLCKYSDKNNHGWLDDCWQMNRDTSLYTFIKHSSYSIKFSYNHSTELHVYMPCSSV